MKIQLSNEQDIIKTLFKDYLVQYNSRNLSKLIGISHPGTYKILKKMEKQEIVTSKKIGNTTVYSLNYDNPITLSLIQLALTIESQNKNRWLEEFKEMNQNSKFAILYGSILKDEKSAKDIDLLIVASKDEYLKIKRMVDEKNKLSMKPIHLLFQTEENFVLDMIKRNKVTIEIIKKGIVLFGQDKFIKTIIKNE